MADEEIKSEEGAGATPEDIEAAKVAEEEKASKEAEDEVFKDAEGNEFVPRKAFDARVGKLTARAKENAEAAELLKAINDDPAVRKEFLSQYGQPEKKEVTKEGYVSSWGPYVDGLPKESQDAMRKFEQGIGPDIKHMIQTEANKVRAEYDSKLQSIQEVIGEQELDKFVKAVPDAKSYLPQIHRLMADNEKLTVSQAYGAAASGDLFKKGMAAQKKESQDLKTKLLKTPVAKVGGGAQVKGSGKMSIDEGIQAAIDQHAR